MVARNESFGVSRISCIARFVPYERLLGNSCDSVEKLKAEIPRIRTFIDNEKNFKSFYSFCFGFSKEPGQKSLSLEIAQAMWELLLLPRFTKLAHWLKFLETSPCRGITRDTWDLLLDFMIKVEKSYAQYDESEAWPVLIDDFMTWVESNQLK
jgi:DCN1-like protein 1/2